MLYWDGGQQKGLLPYHLFKSPRSSAFVGLAVMVITFPIPGYLASKVQSIQDERLKRTDSRVQIVTESELIWQRFLSFLWIDDLQL